MTSDGKGCHKGWLQYYDILYVAVPMYEYIYGNYSQRPRGEIFITLKYIEFCLLKF
jgi:hypothetical protein